MISRLTRFVVSEILNYNSEAYVTQQPMLDCLFLIEEAQNYLNQDKARDDNDPIIRLAKEGRKYKLGLIYVTQQPSAIDDNILSQTNNFFVMHLLTNQDVHKLCSIAPQYELYAENIQQEPIRGTAYIYSNVYEEFIKPFPLVVCTELENFNNVVAVVNTKRKAFVQPVDKRKEIEEIFVKKLMEFIKNGIKNISWRDLWGEINKELPDDNIYKNSYGGGKPYPSKNIIHVLEEKYTILKWKEKIT